MFDISTLALADTFTLHLKHPVTGEKLYADEKQEQAVTITIYGTSSKKYRNAVTAMQNRQLRRKAKDKASAEDLQEEGIGLMVACSASSENLAIDGEEVKTEAQFRKLYSDPRFSWIKDQVDEALADVSNFLGK